MKVWSSQLWLRFKQSQLNPKNGIRTHGLCVSAAVLHQLSYEDLYVGSRPICWIYRTRERETYEYYVNCGHANEIKVWSLQLCLWFKQSQLSSKNVFEALTGFEPMASALALQCSTNWAMKSQRLGVVQFVEFIVPVKGMKHMNIMWTADIRMKWRSDHRSCDCDLSNRKVSQRMGLHSSVGGALQR